MNGLYFLTIAIKQIQIYMLKKWGAVMSIGARLYNLRVNENLSMAELGAKFGIARNTVYRWESNEFAPKRTKLIALAKFYGVSVDWILNGIVTEENELERKLNIPNRIGSDTFKHDLNQHEQGSQAEFFETIMEDKKDETFLGHTMGSQTETERPVEIYTEQNHLLKLFAMLSESRQGKLLGYLDALCSEELTAGSVSGNRVFSENTEQRSKVLERIS